MAEELVVDAVIGIPISENVPQQKTQGVAVYRESNPEQCHPCRHYVSQPETVQFSGKKQIFSEFSSS
jgi:hypothetical protein